MRHRPMSRARPASARAVTIRSWQPDQRRLGVGPGAISYLEVHENYDTGLDCHAGRDGR